MNLRIALAVVGETPALYITIVRIQRSLNNIERVRVRPQELWLKASIHAFTGQSLQKWWRSNDSY